MITLVVGLLVAQVDTATVAVATSTVIEPLHYAKYAAIVDFGWSLALTGAWALSARSWDAPYPDGVVAIAAARILYGTTWTVLVAADVAVLQLIAGEEWSGLSRGAFKNHWLVGFEVPGSCKRRGDAGGVCGLGLGSFGEISVRISSEYPLRGALTGGWIQGRFHDDAERTLIESTWVQAPVNIWYEPRARLGPIGLELSIGAGWYWGMHNAHVHPKPDVELPAERDVPIYELVPLHYGTGIGVRVAVALSFFETVALVADAELAPFLLGGSNEGARAKVEPLLVFDATGVPIYRKLMFGLRFSFAALHPLVLSAKIAAIDLSPRSLDRAGHLAAGAQFEVPIDLESDEED